MPAAPVNPSGGLRVPLQLPNRIVQRTACVITTFVDHVSSALALRNRFAERPFVARPLLSKNDSLFVRFVILSHQLFFHPHL